MSHRLSPGVVAGLFLAALGWVSPAHAGVVQSVAITGNPATCADYAGLLATQHSITFGGFPSFELKISNPKNITYGPSAVGGLKIQIQGLSNDDDDGKPHFNWNEVSEPKKRRVDFVGIRTYNTSGRTVHVYFPDAGSGVNLSAIHSSKKITEIMFCGDNIDESVVDLATCPLSLDQVDTVCGALGPGRFFEVEEPGTAPNAFQCACPPIAATACSVSSPSDLPSCSETSLSVTGNFTNLSGDQGIPNDGSTCTLKCYSFGATRTCVNFCVP